MASLRLAVVNTFWNLELVEDERLVRRTVSLPPPQRKDLDDGGQDCCDEVGYRWKESASRLALEHLPSKWAIQTNSLCFRAGAEFDASVAEGSNSLQLEIAMENAPLKKTTNENQFELRSEFHESEEPPSASLTGDMQHVLELKDPDSSATTADDAIQLLKQSPSMACFNNPANWASGVCDQVDAFQGMDFHKSATELAPAADVAWHVTTVDELVALKQKLVQALTASTKTSASADHVLTCARKSHMVRKMPDVEDLLFLRNKLHQALLSSKTVSMHQTVAGTSMLQWSTFTTGEYCSQRVPMVASAGRNFDAPPMHYGF